MVTDSIRHADAAPGAARGHAFASRADLDEAEQWYSWGDRPPDGLRESVLVKTLCSEIWEQRRQRESFMDEVETFFGAQISVQPNGVPVSAYALFLAWRDMRRGEPG